MQEELLRKQLKLQKNDYEEKRSESKSNSGQQRISTDTLDLVKIMGGKHNNPFVPHEENLSRYSATVQEYYIYLFRNPIYTDRVHGGAHSLHSYIVELLSSQL